MQLFTIPIVYVACMKKKRKVMSFNYGSASIIVNEKWKASESAQNVATAPKEDIVASVEDYRTRHFSQWGWPDSLQSGFSHTKQ